MATGEELRAADTLAISLERESLLLVSALFAAFDPSSGTAFTQKAIESVLHAEIIASIGKLWGPTANFLKISTGTPKDQLLKMAELRWPEVYERNTAIAQKMLKFQSIQPLAEAGAVLNDVVTSQVDQTQARIGFEKAIKWRRHVDAKGCGWCRDQVGNYAATRQWLRHPNCKCFKVKE